MNVTEGAAYGAALLAGVGVGVFPTVQAACDATLAATTRTDPITAHRAIYASLYGRYRDLYPALRSSFEQLAAVTPDCAADRHQMA